MEIAGYIASVIIGIALGLIGGGGSILTVPVLVYLFGIDPVIATAYSLFIVGTTSLVGAIPKYRQGLVNLKRAVIFGIPSIAAVFITRKFLVPLIPHHLFNAGSFEITKPIPIINTNHPNHFFNLSAGIFLLIAFPIKIPSTAAAVTINNNFQSIL